MFQWGFLKPSFLLFHSFSIAIWPCLPPLIPICGLAVLTLDDLPCHHELVLRLRLLAEPHCCLWARLMLGLWDRTWGPAGCGIVPGHPSLTEQQAVISASTQVWLLQLLRIALLPCEKYCSFRISLMYPKGRCWIPFVFSLCFCLCFTRAGWFLVFYGMPGDVTFRFSRHLKVK